MEKTITKSNKSKKQAKVTYGDLKTAMKELRKEGDELFHYSSHFNGKDHFKHYSATFKASVPENKSNKKGD